MQNKKYIIYGARGHGKALFYNLKNDGLDIICFIDRDKKIIKSNIKNIPIYKNISEVNKNYPQKENKQMILGEGGASSKDRKYLFEKVHLVNHIKKCNHTFYFLNIHNTF